MEKKQGISKYIQKKPTMLEYDYLDTGVSASFLPSFHKFKSQIDEVVSSLFMQNSIPLNWKGEELCVDEIEEQFNSDRFSILARKFRSFYSYDTVIQNKPVTEEVKDEYRKGTYENIEWEKISDRDNNKPHSYLNILSVSTSLEKHPTMQNNKALMIHRYNISKIVHNRITGSELIIYNYLKDSWRSVLLDSFRLMKQPCKHHAFGKKSGYYFVYDNQGIIHILFENLKICELNLPDERQDPTLFVYEKNTDQTILFVAGGYFMKSSGALILDTVAVFYLNFKEQSKIMNYEPFFYIKMKYPRLNPTIFKHRFNRSNSDIVFCFLGGNHYSKMQSFRWENSKKKSINMLDEANEFCETVSLKSIKDNIFRSDFNKVQMISTESTLMVMFNGDNTEESQSNKTKNYLGESAVVNFRSLHLRKKPYIIGLGKKNKEIWLIDKILSHKIILVKTRSCLKENKNEFYCKTMLGFKDQELFYFNNIDDKSLKYKKLLFNRSMAEISMCGKNDCHIF